MEEELEMEVVMVDISNTIYYLSLYPSTMTGQAVLASRQEVESFFSKIINSTVLVFSVFSFSASK